MPIYYPRVHATIWVPLWGETAEQQQQLKDTGAIEIDVRPFITEWERNDHNHADTLKLTVAWQDAGVDPRMLESARVQMWLDDAKSSGSWAPSPASLRFAGTVMGVTRKGGGGNPMTVEIDCADYTMMFITQKPFDPKGVPLLTDTLAQAWSKICDFVGWYDISSRTIVSSVADLKDAVVFQGDAASIAQTPIGKATSARFTKIGRIQPQQGADAWAVWSQCCGMLGLITFFDKDKLIVTTGTDLYTETNPPVFIYGRNIKEWSESAGTSRTHKGVALTSFDPLTGTIRESFYPPPGDPRVKMKRTPAKKVAAQSNTIQSEQYEFFEVPGITDQAYLDTYAQRVFEEYSRQQVEGTLSTVEMAVNRVNDPAGASSTYDLLNLGAGDAVQIQFDLDSYELAELSQYYDVNALAEYLVGRGYTQGIALLIAKNFDAFSSIAPVFHSKTVRVKLETDETGGSFQIDLCYVNLIQPPGSANPDG